MSGNQTFAWSWTRRGRAGLRSLLAGTLLTTTVAVAVPVSEVYAVDEGVTLNSITVNPDTSIVWATPGSQLVYTINYSCNGILLPDCAGTTLSVTLPTFVDIYGGTSQLGFVSATYSSSDDWDAPIISGTAPSQVLSWDAAPTVDCNGSPNEGQCTGDSGAIVFTLRVPLGIVPVLPAPQPVLASATASRIGNVDVSTVGPVTSYINAAGPGSTVAKSGPSSVLLNSAGSDDFTYTIQVCPEAGEALYPAYTITDTLPVGVTVVDPLSLPYGGVYTAGTPSTEIPPVPPLTEPTLVPGTGGTIVWTDLPGDAPGLRNPATGCLELSFQANFVNRYASGDLSNVILADKTNEVTATGHPEGGGDVGIGAADTTLTLNGPVTRFRPSKNTGGNYYIDNAPPDNVVTYYLGASNTSDAEALPFSTATLTDGPFPAGFTLTEIRTGSWEGAVTGSVETSPDGSTWTQVSTAENATINSGLGGVQYVRWVFTSPGAPEIGPGWDATGQRLTGTISGSPTETFTNCAGLTGEQDAVLQDRGQACADVLLEEPQPHPSISKSAPGTVSPGDTISYTLVVANDSDATDVLVNPQLTDCVPASEYLTVDNLAADGDSLPANGWTIEDFGSPCTPTHPSAANSGTLIQLQYTGILNPGDAAPTITYDVTADGFHTPLPTDTPTPPDVYTNTARVTQADGITSFGHCVQDDCESSHSTTVPVTVQLQSEKFVQGAFDREFNKAGTTTPGGQVQWKLVLKNISNVRVNQVTFIDIFSYVGDTGVRVSTKRGSEYVPYLVSPITAPLGWTVYYSTATNPCRGEVLGPTSSCTAPAWTSTPDLAALSTYKSIKIEYAGTVAIGDELEFTYEQVTPVFDPTYDLVALDGDPYDALDDCTIPNSLHPWDPSQQVAFPGDSTLDATRTQEDAWVDSDADGIQDGGEGGPTCPRASNSFAYGVNALAADLNGLDDPGRLGAEPRKVDLHVAAEALLNAIGNRVWDDADNDGIQDSGEVGIANVRVELHDGGGLVDTTFTDTNGYYSFEDLPDGTYTVRFYMPDDRGYVSPRDQSGSPTDQALTADNTDDDSDIPRTPTGTDGVGNYYETTTVTIGNDPAPGQENDPTWDAGIWIPRPSIVVEKYVQGEQALTRSDADTATGPQIPRGDTVTWTYEITNTGNSYLHTVSLTDHVNAGGGPDPVPLCDWDNSTDPATGPGVLSPARGAQPAETVTCTATGVAVRGQYTNTATVTGVPALDDGVTTITGKTGVPPSVSDTDPANYFGVEYDLALVKIVTPASVQQDGTVTWTIRVRNQGNVASGAFSVTDVIPAGMSLVSSNPAYTANPTTRTYRWDFQSSLAANAFTDIEIVTQVTDMRMRPFRNWAEISADSAQTLYSTDDYDSTPDTDVGNDNGTGAGSGPNMNPNDPFVDITSLSGIPDDQRPTDEDDNDYAEVSGDLVYDLALAKVADESTATAGDNITWRVRVYNQGNVRSGVAQVTDKLPTGLTYVSGTVLTSADAPLANSSCVVAVDGFTVTCEISNIGAGDYVTIVIVTDITNDNLSTAPWRNWAEISADSAQALYDVDDQDSTPDTNTGRNNTFPNDAYVGITTIPSTYANGPGINDPVDQDDNDDAIVTNDGVYDLALIKTGPSSPVLYDDTIQFTITVRNQGNLPSGDYQVTDLVPLGLTPVPGSFGTGTWSPLNRTITWNVTASLAGSNDATFGYSATITDINLRPFRNFAEISDDSAELYGLTDVDSTPDANTANDGTYPTVGAAAGSGIDNLLISEAGNDNNDPQDDADIADINVDVRYDLALVKVVEATSIAVNGLYNGTATFDVTVQNQGTVPSNDFVITDYVPVGLTPVIPVPNSGVWNLGARTITWTIDNLDPGDTATRSYEVTITDFTARPYRNLAEITSDSAIDYLTLDIDSTPDLNTGNDGSYPALLADPGTGIDNLSIGEAGNDNGDPQDDADIADLSFPLIYDLALIKVNDGPPVVQYDDTIQFTITVQNQGMVDSNEFTVFDTLPDGLSLLSAGGGTVNGHTISWTISNLAPGASTTRTFTMEISDITLRPYRNLAEISTDSADDYDASLIDVYDIDSAPDENPNNDGEYPPLLEVPVPGVGSDNLLISEAGEEIDDEPNPTLLAGQDDADIADVGVEVVYDLALAKVSNTSLMQPDGSVMFTITVTNQGTVPSGDFTVTDHLPDGMHATAASNAGDRSVEGIVTWNLGGLDPGQSISVTTTVVIDDITKRPFKNIAEINQDDADLYDTLAINVEDPDSDPDATTDNDNEESGGGVDGYGTIEHPTNDVVDTDGSEGPSAGGEDDADVAFVDVEMIYDLTLVKTGPEAFDGAAPGTFTITVKNQGNLASGEFIVLDEVPVGLDAVSADNGGVISVDGSEVVWTIANLAAGATITLHVDLQITEFSTRPWVNVAEIIEDSSYLYDSDGYESPTDGLVTDADSQPDPDLLDDVLVDQTVLPEPQYNDPNTDEDDHDVASVAVDIDYDLALVKKVLDGQSYKVGNPIVFNITVMNQGNVDSGPITVIDDLPTGISFLSADHGGQHASQRVSWDLDNLAPNEIIVLAVSARMVNASLTSYVNRAEIAADSADQYDLIEDEVVIEDVEDDDSTSDDSLTNDPLVDTDDVTVDQLGGDEDDHDRALLDPAKVASDNAVPGLPLTGSDQSTLPWGAWALALGLAAVVIARRRRRGDVLDDGLPVEG